MSFNFMAAATIFSDFWSQEKKVCHYFYSFPSICHEVTGSDAMILVFWMLSFKPACSLSFFIFIKRLSSSLLFVIRNAVICISEVIDISHSNLDSILCFIQPGTSHYVLCIEHIFLSSDWWDLSSHLSCHFDLHSK